MGMSRVVMITASIGGPCLCFLWPAYCRASTPCSKRPACLSHFLVFSSPCYQHTRLMQRIRHPCSFGSHVSHDEDAVIVSPSIGSVSPNNSDNSDSLCMPKTGKPCAAKKKLAKSSRCK